MEKFLRLDLLKTDKFINGQPQISMANPRSESLDVDEGFFLNFHTDRSYGTQNLQKGKFTELKIQNGKNAQGKNTAN